MNKKELLNDLIKNCYWDMDVSVDDLLKFARSDNFRIKMGLFQKILYNAKNRILLLKMLFDENDLKKLFDNVDISYMKDMIEPRYLILRNILLNENNKIDFGRYNVTKDKDDKYYFKVPTLRNIDLTAPYLHTGTINNLEDVVKIMMKYQLGITKFKKKDIDKIVKFLKTLTGEVKELK